MRLTGPRVVAAGVFVADVSILRWVGVPFWVQLYFAVFLAACAGTGALLLRRKHALLPDHACFVLVALALGLALHMGLCFLGLHGVVIDYLHLAGQRAAMQVVFGIVAALGIVGWIRVFRNRPELAWCAHPRAASAIFAIASFIAVSTHFGFGNDLTFRGHARNEVENWAVAEIIDERSDPSFDPDGGRAPEWGSRIDSLMYVWLIPSWTEYYGLPDVFRGPRSTVWTLGKFQHLGVEVQLLGVLEVIAPFSPQSSAAVSKLLSLVWMCLLGAWLFWIGRAVLGLSASTATVAAAGGFLFSALAFSAFGRPRATPSHTLGYVATPIFWNLNQLSHLAIGLGGLFLVLLDLARPRKLYAAGCVLLAASFYFKPSLFFVAVPAIGLASLRLGRSFLRRDIVLGWLAILAICALWVAYPLVCKLKLLQSPIDLVFLERQSEWGKYGALPLHWVPYLSPVTLKAVVLVGILGAWILPLLALGATCLARWTRCRGRLGYLWRPEVLAQILLLAWGLFTAFCFVEDNERRAHSNFQFGGAAAYSASMPLLILAITKVENRFVRALAWLVYAAHLASGLFNLWYYAETGYLS